MSQKMIVRSFWSIFLVVYLIVGYVRQSVFVRTEWAMDATIWDKFVSTYLSGFILNIVPAFVISLILGFILNYYMSNSVKSNKPQPKPDANTQHKPHTKSTVHGKNKK